MKVFKLGSNKILKTIKSRLNSDGLILADAIIAFLFLSIIAFVIIGYMGTTIRTSPTIEHDAENHQESMVAISKSLSKTSVIKKYDLELTSYVPSRSLTEPSTLYYYNNYDTITKKIIGLDNHKVEILGGNIIPASSMHIKIRPITLDYSQRVTTMLLKGAKYTFEPVSNISSILGEPTSDGYYFINRGEKDNSRVKHIDTLNYPTSYGGSEVMIYENGIK